MCEYPAKSVTVSSGVVLPSPPQAESLRNAYLAYDPSCDPSPAYSDACSFQVASEAVLKPAPSLSERRMRKIKQHIFSIRRRPLALERKGSDSSLSSTESSRFSLFRRNAVPPTYEETRIESAWAQIGIDVNNAKHGPPPKCTPQELTASLDAFFGSPAPAKARKIKDAGWA